MLIKKSGSLEGNIASSEITQVDHPRCLQAHERRIDSSPFPKTISTLMFNGYGDQVANL
jgi:methionine sulfoxide reductase catalytic subunit